MKDENKNLPITFQLKIFLGSWDVTISSSKMGNF